MAGKLKDLYVKRNQNQYQPAADSWEARAAELSNMSGGAMPQGETAGNGKIAQMLPEHRKIKRLSHALNLDSIMTSTAHVARLLHGMVARAH